MALPKEPRQKMINIMYLVLTAILALNVSAEILNAFKTVERSLTTTNTTINESTETIMKSFEEKKQDPTSKAKAELWAPKAAQAVALTKDMNAYIESLKAEIMKGAGFDPKAKNGDSSFKEDNQDVATRIMVEQKKGVELRAKLEQYKKNMMAIDDSLGKDIEARLKQIDLQMPPTKNKANKNWEDVYFRMVPTVAATTMLAKFQNDIKTSENRVVALFHEQVGAVKVRFDRFAAIVGQSSNYVMPGQELEVRAGIGAFSTASKPTINIGGSVIPINEDGVSVWKTTASGNGERSLNVSINYTDQDGNAKTETQTIKYTVGSANASIALDDMNVLYIGIQNKLTIAASGAGDDKVQASISGGGGSLRRIGGGKWIATVNSITDAATITVSVDGRVMGASQFRVRTIPPASAFVGGYESGSNVNAGAFIAQAGVGAGIKNFPLNLSYKVVSFTVTADNDDGDIDSRDCVGNTWSSAAAAMLRKNVKPGRLVTLDNIRVQGPDGRVTGAPSLVYYIK